MAVQSCAWSNRVVRGVLLAGAGLLLYGAEPLLGQRMLQRTAADDRPALDYFVSRYMIAGEAERSASDGVGGRLMWPLGTLTPTVPWASRTAVGAFLVHAPDRDGRQQMWWYGAQADLRLMETRIVDRVDPLLSLGFGATRSDILLAPGGVAPEIANPVRRPVSETRLSVAPGVGLRFHVAPGFGIRGDARQIYDLTQNNRRNLEFSAGLSLGT